MKKIALALSTVLVLGLTSAQESSGTTFGDLDQDTSGDVTAEEFAVGFGADRYADFDADGSGSLDQTEFTLGLFGLFDVDGNEVVTQNEVNLVLGEREQGTNAFWGGEFAGTTFRDLDTSSSGEVSQEEFTAGFDAGGAFTTFDADASSEVDEDEFSEGLFGTIDANEDGVITEDEVTQFPIIFGNDRVLEDSGTEGATSDDGSETEQDDDEGEAAGE